MMDGCQRVTLLRILAAKMGTGHFLIFANAPEDVSKKFPSTYLSFQKVTCMAELQCTLDICKQQFCKSGFFNDRPFL
jgi:hypothetical protein